MNLPSYEYYHLQMSKIGKCDHFNDFYDILKKIYKIIFITAQNIIKFDWKITF